MTLTGHRTNYLQPALQCTEREGQGALVPNDYPPQRLAAQFLPIPVRPTRRHTVEI